MLYVFVTLQNTNPVPPLLTPPTTNTLVTDYIDHSCYLTMLEITEIIERSVVGRRV